MYFTTLNSLVLLALSIQSASADLPNGITAMYSIFDHVGCDIQSHGMVVVPDENVEECQNFMYPTISVDIHELQEGCAVNLYRYADCGGPAMPVDEAGCFNHEAVLMSSRMAC
ncbi:hypothetical protein SAPIO_CDS4905 [Scedosporium apiospermum]|uniref:Uncharacterized protein n=1 Tax=Pseudallescheria apiosperma TaxID=563466 RepID=A0A084G7B3_PSEDA|nr:uncharacterized protein SAPIO_CDS4905 [Scedosporium apiospermum]KEZ43225.1 hypothetical protein SAPIO_CDS4905 [Scedosporium apiospermum]